MKRLLTIIFYFSLSLFSFADIAPNPIVVKGIYTLDSCKIIMISETVIADLYNDSARVDCIFELYNTGDSITIDVGFPEMNFQYWSCGDYDISDKTYFNIYVDENLLSSEQIKVPEELDSIYQVYMNAYLISQERKRKYDSIMVTNNVEIRNNGTRKYPSGESYEKTQLALDSLYNWKTHEELISADLMNQFDQQINKGNYPWYVWKVHFEKNEKKTLKVTYTIPSGLGYGANYRYFKYLLHTGAGWLGEIEKAKVTVKLHDISLSTIEELSPSNYSIKEPLKQIDWDFEHFDPTTEDDIYIRYYNPAERKEWEKYSRKIQRKLDRNKKK